MIANNPSPTVTFGIPTFGRNRVLCETIRQVLHQTHTPDQIVIVDQTKDEDHDEETLRFLQKCDSIPGFRRVYQEIASLPKALNRIVQESQTDMVIFCDDDIEMPSTLVEDHLSVFAKDPSLAAVGAQVLPRSGTAVDSLLPRSPWGFHRSLCPKNFAFRFEGPVIGGGNFSVRRMAWIAAGGADENVKFMSDEELAARMDQLGMKVVYDPSCSVRHLEAGRGGQAARRTTGLFREFNNCFSVMYFGMRYRRGFAKAGTIAQGFRASMDRQTVLRPWRIPWALTQFASALASATVRSFQQRRSPFDTTAQAVHRSALKRQLEEGSDSHRFDAASIPSRRSQLSREHVTQ